MTVLRNGSPDTSVLRILCRVLRVVSQVSAKEVPLAKAQAINGLRAVFGEVYPDPVRVVRERTVPVTRAPFCLRRYRNPAL